MKSYVSITQLKHFLKLEENTIQDSMYFKHSNYFRKSKTKFCDG